MGCNVRPAPHHVVAEHHLVDALADTLPCAVCAHRCKVVLDGQFVTGGSVGRCNSNDQVIRHTAEFQVCGRERAQ